MPEKLHKRLVLAEWIFRRLGFEGEESGKGLERLSKILKDEPVGWDAQNVFYFRRQLELKLPEDRDLNDDLLKEYDLNIFRHWQSITKRRRVKEHREIYPLYFQYLSLLFTEYYLDRWSEDLRLRSEGLLNEINEFRKVFNERFTGAGAAASKIDEYTPQDLTKLAFWIATGAGKTLIMHCNILQLEHYLAKKNIRRHFNKHILITPNEGLSDQHLQEFDLSGIFAEKYRKDRSGLLDKASVEVIEITKLKEKTGVTTVAVSEFGKNNIVMVDEGHRGTGGDEWFEKRQALCSEGFSLEYSATFGQAVNALSTAKKKEMSQIYAKGVLIDYSYRSFYKDGYGKNFHILNFNEDNSAVDEANQRLYLTACILRFYQQRRLYQDKHLEYSPYLVEDPLMVFVGGSVTGQRRNQQDTDVVSALRSFAEFVSEPSRSIKDLDALLRGQDGLQGPDGPVFRGKFDYARERFPLTAEAPAAALFDDILKIVFRSVGSASLHAVYLKGNVGEIGLRLGDTGPFFGVINVGEPKKLWDLIKEKQGELITCSEQQFGDSLFNTIEEPETDITLLIGAKKFMEGWSCWRVSSMGLVNIGLKEGSQIIQLFGRGVRLKGLDFSLKRSDELDDIKHPAHLGEVETLNVFGLRADYMKMFNEYIKEEDVDSARDIETIILPTIRNLARQDLKVILPKSDMPDFTKKERPLLKLSDRITSKVQADWYGRLQSLTGESQNGGEGNRRPDQAILKQENLAFIDRDKLLFDLLEFKKQKGLYNLSIDRDSIDKLLGSSSWYDLYIPSRRLEFSSFTNVQVWQEIVTDLLKKYCLKLYNFKRDEFEGPFQELRTIKQILDNPGERYNKEFLKSLEVEYEAAIEKSKAQLVSDLEGISEKLKSGEITPYNTGDVTLFTFKRHLYEPLIHVADGTLGISIKPVSLNKHEKQFICDLEGWCEKEMHGLLQERELYVLRNQTKGRGVSFFEDARFSPDFIIWLLEGDTQHIVFADPHGLRHAKGFSDSKVLFSKRVKEIEKQRIADPQVSLHSFILSPTAFEEVAHWHPKQDKNVFLDHNILFMYDDAVSYIGTMFKRVMN